MSDLHTLPPALGPDLPPISPLPVPPRPGDPARPAEATGWRDRLGALAGVLDLSLPRLLGGAAGLAVVAVLGWRLLAPPPAPAELALPMADRSALASHEAAPGPSAAPAGPPSPVTTAPGGEVVVHVVGDVARPGVQHLAAGARVEDAVDAAGGSRPDADLTRLNLAALVQDGQQIYVLKVGEVPPVPVAGATGPAGASPDAPAAPVDLNTATADQLDSLPGVGPATAAAIIATRQERGGFRSVDDLLDVRGIGEAKLAQLRAHVTV